MYKLIILISPQQDSAIFHEQWPRFLRLAEQMPGVVREVTVNPHAHLYGRYRLEMAHELYFDTLKDLETAMLSPVGQAAGSVLQEITGRNVSLIIAEHLEDDLAHIQSLKDIPQDTDE